MSNHPISLPEDAGRLRRTVSFSKNAVNLFFHILTKCNLKCRHCYINPEQHGTETLDIETITRILALFTDDARKANVIFLGGEPTLHPELPAAVRSARDLGYDSITIDTNGYLFHDFLSRVEPGEVDFMSFSLDGACPAVNDPIRGEGSFDACVKGIKKSVAAGFHTSLIYTVSALNLDELSSMPPLISDLGIHRFFIQVIGLRGKSAGEQKSLQVSREDWLDRVPEIAETVAKKGIVTAYPKVYLADDEPFECAGLCAKNHFVFPNGRVYRCPLCEDFPLNAFFIENDALVQSPPISENDLFHLRIPEGCVMNRLVQPGNITWKKDGTPENRIACCMIKEEIFPVK